MRACYTILPANYIHQWYGAKDQAKSPSSDAPQIRFPITNPFLIPRYVMMKCADHVARSQNVPLASVLLRWGLVSYATARSHPELGPVIRRQYWLRRYGLKSTVDYHGRVML